MAAGTSWWNCEPTAWKLSTGCWRASGWWKASRRARPACCCRPSSRSAPGARDHSHPQCRQRRPHVQLLSCNSGTTHKKSPAMKFSPLVERIGGEGADAWRTHSEASAARDRGEDVIILSIGDPDINAPEAVIERTVERLRSGDTHYTPARGRPALREAIAKA